jgi:hypothetical protein
MQQSPELRIDDSGARALPGGDTGGDRCSAA